jgi:hypothetical protein
VDIFTPPDSCDVGATRVWLIMVMVTLAVVGIALLVQTMLLWRREALLHVAWWWRLPLALPLVWAGVCGFVVVLAITSYPNTINWPPCPAGSTCNTNMPACVAVPPLRGEALLVLVGAAVLLILGWIALAALARRIHAT